MFVSPLTAHADGDVPCTVQMRDKLKIANTAPEVCETTTRLVPGRGSVLAIWSTDPDSPAEIPLAAVLDQKALEAGQLKFLYRRKAMGESVEPFLFDGKAVKTAIADFDGSGRIGWAMWVVPDADYFFAITVYDPKTGKFIEPDLNSSDSKNRMSFTATNLDEMVEVSKGKILIPICDSSGGTPTRPIADLYFDVYTLKAGSYEQGKRIPATVAPAAERAKCKQTAQ